jgi:hypothetical protein
VYQNINHFGRVGIQRVGLRCLLAFYRACEFIYVSSMSASWEILSLTLLEKPWQQSGPNLCESCTHIYYITSQQKLSVGD